MSGVRRLRMVADEGIIMSMTFVKKQANKPTVMSLLSSSVTYVVKFVMIDIEGERQNYKPVRSLKPHCAEPRLNIMIATKFLRQERCAESGGGQGGGGGGGEGVGSSNCSTATKHRISKRVHAQQAYDYVEPKFTHRTGVWNKEEERRRRSIDQSTDRSAKQLRQKKSEPHRQVIVTKDDFCHVTTRRWQQISARCTTYEKYVVVWTSPPSLDVNRSSRSSEHQCILNVKKPVLESRTALLIESHCFPWADHGSSNDDRFFTPHIPCAYCSRSRWSALRWPTDNLSVLCNLWRRMVFIQ